jgi:L-lactate dehydrogenase complex protein LldG
VTTRDAFLQRIRERQAPPPSLGPHPPPAPAPFAVRHRGLDGVDATPAALAPVFVEAAERAGAVVHLVAADGVGAAIGALASELGARSVVLSRDPEAQAFRPVLTDLGLAVADHRPDVAADADLGVTSAVAGVAATGSLVLTADRAGGRGAAVLPTVHACVLPQDRLVATTLDAFRAHAARMPSNLTLVTGPSRTGDIELILTVGVHGPVAVHVFLVS